VSPLRGKKPQNRPLSKLNTGRFVLREMLPVISKKSVRKHKVSYEIKCKQSEPPVSFRPAVVHIHTSVHAVVDWHVDYKKIIQGLQPIQFLKKTFANKLLTWHNFS